MSIERLDIVNACLRTMGETKLNSLEEDHSGKDDALDLLDSITEDVLSLKLWFNVEALELKPQATSKYIDVPHDVFEVFPYTRCGRLRVAQRGSRLYDLTRNKYEFDRSVWVTIARRLDFDHLPHVVQRFVRDETVLRFQAAFDGDNTKYAKYEQARERSWVALQSEHIRQLKANPLFNNPTISSMRSRYGVSGSRGPWHWHRTYPG